MHNQLSYQYSRQCNEAIKELSKIIKDKSVIQSEDLLLALISTEDTGAGYVLGKSSITKSKLLKEIESAQVVQTRTEIEIDETNTFNIRRELKKQLSDSSLQLIEETPSGYCLKGFTAEMSTQVKAIFDNAEELRFQNSPDGGIDTYWLLVNIAQDETCNAFHALNKLYAMYASNFNGNLRETISDYLNLHLRYRDGYAEQKRIEQESKNDSWHWKLKQPDFSLLNEICTDITSLAREGRLPKVIGRSQEIERITFTLCRKQKNNAVLIGPGGVGKSAIAEGLAMKIANDEISALQGMKILQFSLSDLPSVALNNNVLNRFKEEIKRERDVILFIDEIHMLGTNKGFTDILKPLMARGDFRVIGATTPQEWNVYISKDQALVRRFERIQVEAPSKDETYEIVSTSKSIYENFHKVSIPDYIVESAIHLADEYLLHEHMPDSVFTLLDDASTLCKLEHDEINVALSAYNQSRAALKSEIDALKSVPFSEDAIQEKRDKLEQLTTEYEAHMYDDTETAYDLQVTEVHLRKIIEMKTDRMIHQEDVLEAKERTTKERERLLDMSHIMKESIIGQDEAVDTVCEAVMRAKTGFRDTTKPVGVFMFAGTTGVGKTQTAKVLAKTLYGKYDDYIRFDMSEYQQQHEVSKLIGAPPGYVGFGQGGLLTEAVKQRPQSIILFDEIEKAHPKVFDTLLQVFDDGRLTDAQGVTVDFTETIIILTTNIGASDMRHEKHVGFGQSSSQLNLQSVKNATHSAIENYFRPEFVNRIDEIITFKPFDKQDIFRITQLETENVISIGKANGLFIKFDDDAIEYLAEHLFDPLNGARPIKRGITKLIETKLAQLVLTGAANRGDAVLITTHNNEIHIEVTGRNIA
ncbi:AAA family ATPase [Macrococcoides canis]|uniref:AAA family ATPase n=1 Tax=Macrococcoides canis TaxID=1855823 RepID=UPI0020B70BD3|nr:ATP-dependent Clp protease ATP-binding subunit [Macrococcus canis]UTH00531.1 ATP-dependent Clp protease ATP-binding subunit [Macrococcus canis]